MKTRRLFFALWPTDAVRQSIAETFSQLPAPVKGRVMPPRNLHITLNFVGAVTDEVKDCMHVTAGSIDAHRFEFSLDRLGTFPKAKIFWMGCHKVPAEFFQLNRVLGDALEHCGYKRESRVYVPHVTLLKKCVATESDQCVFSIPWSVETFALVESTTDKHGVKYQVIEEYSLS